MIMGYSRVQIFATFSAQSFILGSSATSMLNSTGYLKTATGGSDSIVSSRMASAMLQVRRGLNSNRLDRLIAERCLGLAVGKRVPARETSFASDETSSFPASRASLPSGRPVTTAIDFTLTGLSNTNVK